MIAVLQLKADFYSDPNLSEINAKLILENREPNKEEITKECLLIRGFILVCQKVT